MAAAAASAASAATQQADPVGMEDELDFSTTPAADFMEAGLTGLAMGLNLCPEAATSGKRIKMVHKKGELDIAGLKLKWNADFKAGKVLNLRLVTVKPAAAGDDGADSSAEGAGDGAAAGKKRGRKEVDVRKSLQAAHDALVDQGKDAEAAALKAVIDRLV